jgi:hypothetical protein
MNNNFNFQNISSTNIGSQILFLFLTLFIVALLITGIVYLVKLAQQCLEYTGYYETFTNPQPGQYGKQLQDQINKVKQLNMNLDDSVEIFTENIQNTCEVHKEIEDMFIENNATPKSDGEYQLPKDKLDNLLERRRLSAKKQFSESRNIFGKSRNAPVYECFTNPKSGPSVSELEDELRMELSLLVTKTLTILHGDIGKKYGSLDSLIAFNSKNITKSAREIAAPKKENVVEGYEAPCNNAKVDCKCKPDEETKKDDLVNIAIKDINKMSGEDLLSRGRSEINVAELILKTIQTQQTAVNQQVKTMEELKKSAAQMNEEIS